MRGGPHRLTAHRRGCLLFACLNNQQRKGPPPMKRRSKLIAVLSSTVVVATLGIVGVTNAMAAVAPAATALNPNVAPGGNFNLSVWQLQLPTGSPGSPDTIQPTQLKGANGYTNPAYFFTDKNDGSMTFFAPEKGVTTPNSNYARSELREMNSNGSAANWSLAGTHKLSANLRIVFVTKNVCVGQVQPRHRWIVDQAAAGALLPAQRRHHSRHRELAQRRPDPAPPSATCRSAPSGPTRSRSPATRSS